MATRLITVAATHVLIARAIRHRRAIGAAGGTVLTLVILAQTWNVDGTRAGALPSVEHVVGSCHAFATDNERYALSDVSPPVPCDQPHQTETVAVRELPGPFTTRSERLSPEERLRFGNELCADLGVREYLGAGPRDDYRFIGVLLRLPTEEEWRHGVRRYRCELTADDDDPTNPPWANESLREVLTRRSGERFRRCWTEADVQVRCAQPHRAESVNATIPVPPDRFGGPTASLSEPQRQALLAWAVPLCEPPVSEFLGDPVGGTPYRPLPRLTTDGHTVECGVGQPSGQPVGTGSLARLTGSADG